MPWNTGRKKDPPYFFYYLAHLANGNFSNSKTLSQLQHWPHLLFRAVLQACIIHTIGQFPAIKDSGVRAGHMVPVNRGFYNAAQHIDDLHQCMSAFWLISYRCAFCKRIGAIDDRLFAGHLVGIIDCCAAAGRVIDDIEVLEILKQDRLQCSGGTQNHFSRIEEYTLRKSYWWGILSFTDAPPGMEGLLPVTPGVGAKQFPYYKEKRRKTGISFYQFFSFFLYA